MLAIIILLNVSNRPMISAILIGLDIKYQVFQVKKWDMCAGNSEKRPRPFKTKTGLEYYKFKNYKNKSRHNLMDKVFF